MSAAAELLADLRSHGARLRIVGERVRVEGVRAEALPAELLGQARAHRDALRRLLAAERTAAAWHARLELLAAERQHVDGWPREDARRWAYVEVLAEWTEAHPEVDASPSAEAKPIAVAALAARGIPDPRS
jgi:hypothetical protein